MSDFRIRYAVKTSLSQSGTQLPACSKAIFASVMLSEIRQMSPELVCIFACFRPPDNVAAVAVTQQFGRFSNRPLWVKRFQTIHRCSCRCLSRARASLRTRHQGPSIMGVEDEVEQSNGRPCRQRNGRTKRPNELTSSIVPRGTSFHHRVELEFPPIGCDPVRFSCCYGLFPGPAELGAVNPDAVHDHGQPACQRHDRLFHPAVSGDLHRPGLEPGPLIGAG